MTVQTTKPSPLSQFMSQLRFQKQSSLMTLQCDNATSKENSINGPDDRRRRINRHSSLPTTMGAQPSRKAKQCRWSDFTNGYKNASWSSNKKKNDDGDSSSSQKRTIPASPSCPQRRSSIEQIDPSLLEELSAEMKLQDNSSSSSTFVSSDAALPKMEESGRRRRRLSARSLSLQATTGIILTSAPNASEHSESEELPEYKTALEGVNSRYGQEPQQQAIKECTSLPNLPIRRESLDEIMLFGASNEVVQWAE